MVAYLRDLPVCRNCGKPAQVELVNRVNAVMGWYCRPCGRRALKALEGREAVPAVVAMIRGEHAAP